MLHNKKIIWPGLLILLLWHGAGATTENYVKKLADYVFENNSFSFVPANVKQASIIYVEQDSLELFFQYVFPLIKKSFILLSYQTSNGSLGPALLDYVHDTKILKWFNYNVHANATSERSLNGKYQEIDADVTYWTHTINIEKYRNPQATITNEPDLSFSTNSYGTHQPYLYECIKKTTGPVIEFGCGFGSTPLLHDLCKQMGRTLITLEDDAAWLDQFKANYLGDGYMPDNTGWHKMFFVPGKDKVLNPEVDPRHWVKFITNSDLIKNLHFDVCFIDSHPWLSRYEAIKFMKNKSTYIVVHDCDYFPREGIFGKTIKPIDVTCNGDGVFDFSDIGTYFKVYFPQKPWPGETGPPTLVASNFFPVEQEKKPMTQEQDQLVNHVKKCINLASQEKSNITNDILSLDGMSSPKIRHLLNNLCTMPNTNYFEVGVYKGSTLVSALYGNHKSINSAIAVDNWSEFGFLGDIRTIFLNNVHGFIKNIPLQIYEMNAFSLNKKAFKSPVNIYFYDGQHSFQAQKSAFTYFNDIFADTFIVIVDDFNWNTANAGYLGGVQDGTKAAFDELKYNVLFEQILPADSCGDVKKWWNGLYVGVVSKK